MRHEEVEGARSDGVFGRTFQQAYADQPLGQLAVGFEMNIFVVFHARPDDAGDMVVGVEHVS